MRVPRVRFTIRWLLAIVVLIAVGLGGFLAGVRWERHRLVVRVERFDRKGLSLPFPFVSPNGRVAGVTSSLPRRDRPWRG